MLKFSFVDAYGGWLIFKTLGLYQPRHARP
jgi:hypothetical protein